MFSRKKMSFCPRIFMDNRYEWTLKIFPKPQCKLVKKRGFFFLQGGLNISICQTSQHNCYLYKQKKANGFLYTCTSDRLNIRFDRTVWPNFYCAVWPKWQNFFLQNIELFFVLHLMPMASFHTFVSINDPHVHGVLIVLLVKQPKECQQSQNWNKTIILT